MTDGGVALKGWEVTDVAVGNVVLPASAFSADGWIRVDGQRQQKTDRYYIAEYRTYDGFDASLKDCYQFNGGYSSWVDWFSYNRGLHLIYRDAFYEDNDVAAHIGVGGWMVVDAHPKVDSVAYSDGAHGLRRLLETAHPGARRVVQPQADQDAEPLLHGLRPVLSTARRLRSASAPLRVKPRSRSSTTRGRTGTLTPRRPG